MNIKDILDAATEYDGVNPITAEIDKEILDRIREHAHIKYKQPVRHQPKKKRK